MKSFLCSLLPLVALAAKGQQPWTFTYSAAGQDAFVTDLAFPPDEGPVLTCGFADPAVQPPFAGAVMRLSQDGLLQYEHRLMPAAESYLPNVLLQGPDGRLHVLGSYVVQDLDAGFFHYGCGTDGTAMDSAFHQAPGAINAHVENASFIGNGNMVLGGSITIGNVPSFNYSYLVAMDTAGTLVNSYTYGVGSPFNLQLTRDVIPYKNGVLISVEQAPVPQSMYVTFPEADLQPGLSWYGHGPNNNPDNPLDSVLKGAMTILPVDNGEYLVGGVYNYDSGAYRPAVYRMDSTGTTLGAFLPSSMHYPDFAAIQGCLARMDGNSFYLLAWENMSLDGEHPPYQPTGPDALHVYKLDNQLNLLCDFTLDGFAENFYYLPMRIKTTPVGGFALIGGRKDMNEPESHFVAWAQTFSPADCTVGIQAPDLPATAMVFPNPGHDGFDIELNGSGPAHGAITLYDALGQPVASTPIQGIRGRVDAANLAPGIYLYRVTGLDGRPYATGRWEKQ